MEDQREQDRLQLSSVFRFPGNATQRRLFVTFLIIINATAALLLWPTLLSSTRTLQAEARAQYQTVVSETSRDVDFFVRNSLFQLGSIALDDQVESLVRADGAGQMGNSVRINAVRELLGRMKVHSEHTHSAYFFKFDPPLILTDRGAYEPDDFFADRLFYEQLAAEADDVFSRYSIYSRQITPAGALAESRATEVLTLTLPVNVVERSAALVLNIDLDWFSEEFDSLLQSLRGTTALLLEDTPIAAFPQTELPGEAVATDQETAVWNGVRHAVFRRSGNYGLSAVHFAPVRYLYSGARFVRTTLLVLWIVAILFSIPLALLVQSIVYRPFSRLYGFLRENSYVPDDSVTRSGIESLLSTYKRLADTNLIYRRQLADSRPLLDEMLLMNILSGTRLPALQSSNYQKNLLSQLSSRYLQCVILEIDGYFYYAHAHTVDQRGEDSAYMLQVIDTYFPEAHTVAHLLEDRIVMVVPSDQPEASDATFEISLRSMKVRMEDYIQQTVSVAVGSRISTVHELHHSYTAAEGALEQKFVRGKGQIIHHSTVHGTHATDQLEEETLKALQQAVRNLSRRQAAAALKEAVASIEPGPRLKEVYKLSGSRILAALEGVMADQEMELPELSEIGEVIERSETVAELETWYFTVLNKIFHQVELHKRSKNIDYLEKIERILEEQYSNPYLQIADVAEEFQLSPTYFGRFFHELTGLNFTNYVNEVRLKHASEMLTTTDLSVNDVAERAGFNSTQYFIRVFKKKFHITPRTYRQRETEKQNV